jgi:hypothetical protein
MRLLKLTAFLSLWAFFFGLGGIGASVDLDSRSAQSLENRQPAQSRLHLAGALDSQYQSHRLGG